MQRNLIATLVQIAVFVVFCFLVFFQIFSVNTLQEHVLESNRRVEELNDTVARLRNELETGGITVRNGSSSGGDADSNDSDEWISRYYSESQWDSMTQEGNYITFRNDPYRVEGAVEGGTIRRAAISDIPGLNPITQNAADVSELYHYVQESLASRQRSDPDRWVGDLATRIEVNDDYTEYHVWLRDDVEWHPVAVDSSDARFDWARVDHQLVADDFVFFLELVMNPQVEAAHLRNYYEACDGIEVISDHEFIVRWSEPQHQSISFTLSLAPLPRWLYGSDQDGRLYDASEVGLRFNEHWYNNGMIGTGPYRFESWTPGGTILLSRNDEYWGDDPAPEAIEYRVIGDATARLNNLAAGQIDFINMQPTQYKNAVVEGGTDGFTNGSLEVETFQGTAYRYLGWDGDGPYFGDRRVRLAMTHALDRGLLLRENMHNLGTQITGSFFVNGPDYNNELQPWPYDLERAAQLLTEAGWVDGDGDGIREKVVDGQRMNFEFGMMTYGYRPEFVAAMEHYRNDLRSIGVVMNVEPCEWAVIVERMEEKDFDAYTGGWVLGWESDPYQIWHSSQADEPAGSNRVGFRNAEADQIIEEARRTFDPTERSALFHRFHEIIHEEQPYTFWFSGLEIGAWRSELKNVNFAPIRPFTSNRNWYLAP
ncbi:MAG: ABC-type transport system substrate-binding protein [Bradymonadia bacterium]|jgi:ABC-type transport system substrate-binding protein